METTINNKTLTDPMKTKDMIENSESGRYETTEKCQQWLEKCTISDDCSVYSDSDSSIFTDSTSNSAMDSGFTFQDNGVVVANRIFSSNNDHGTAIVIKDSTPKYDNTSINVYKSKKVHVGDVTVIKGPVLFNNSNSAYNDKLLSIPYSEPYVDTFIVDRINWLAQPPLGEREKLEEPVKYVIIGHTATEEGFTQADNTLLVRLIQTFHIESRKWKDIAYNFLIGSDGLAYEGRGWGVIGSHTRNFNSKSIGISFIGCFIDHLPPESALKKAQDLIETGIKRGSIDPDYKLLGHCQCSGVESPGRRLFEEIQTWKNWDKSVEVSPSNFTLVIDEPPDDPESSQ
ncbi:unnamed protein product [Diabrotica balteata]|uniref:Uncharacterized protein n=1 Tax=Diabrotica balteata TaxID=107213 RepID=A0A9N9T9V6_DIABA|nr:unnamed protein product [Diabrotica balteata]